MSIECFGLWVSGLVFSLNGLGESVVDSGQLLVSNNRAGTEEVTRDVAEGYEQCRVEIPLNSASIRRPSLSIFHPKCIRGPATKSSALIIFASSKKMATKSSSRTRSASSASTAPPAKRQKITVAPFAAAFPRRTLLSSSRWVNKVPHDIWVHQILHPFLDLKALSTVGRCNTFFEEYWQYVLKQNLSLIHI